MSNLTICKNRQAAFSKAWFKFVISCKKRGVKMNQTIAANNMGLKRSTFSTAVNYGPSDTVLLRFCLFTGVNAATIDPSLEDITPMKVANG